MRRVLILFMAFGLLVPLAEAGSLADVTFEDEVMVGESTVKLNGMGLRKKLWVKVYVGGLYLENPTTNATNAAESKQTKKMVMRFLTNKAKKKKMDAAWLEGFEANSADFASLKERVMRFKDFFGDMKEDDFVEIVMVPGEGTIVSLNGAEMGTIDGDDFAEALVRVWVGTTPPSEDFKTGVLGG